MKSFKIIPQTIVEMVVYAAVLIGMLKVSFNNHHEDSPLHRIMMFFKGKKTQTTMVFLNSEMEETMPVITEQFK